MEDLRDLDWRKRRKACVQLGEMGGRGVVGPLLERLGDARREVAQAASAALASLGEAPLADAVFGALEHFEVSVKALAGLAVRGDLRAVEPLLALWQDPSSPVRGAARAALHAIAAAVEPRIDTFLCGACLTVLVKNELALHRGDQASWFACRVCSKTSPALAGVREVVAVLDASWAEDLVMDRGSLRVNWLREGGVFDFDRVEIARARDFDVERFAIAVSGDMDEVRYPRYRGMPCAVSRDCHISEPVRRVLQGVFREVRFDL
jgi:hypothetical protein